MLLSLNVLSYCMQLRKSIDLMMFLPSFLFSLPHPLRPSHTHTRNITFPPNSTLLYHHILNARYLSYTSLDLPLHQFIVFHTRAVQEEKKKSKSPDATENPPSIHMRSASSRRFKTRLVASCPNCWFTRQECVSCMETQAKQSFTLRRTPL